MKDETGGTRLLALLALLGSAVGQLVSPCPGLFSYETQKDTDRWYAIVTLKSESDLNGVWLRLIFDRPALQLGNWFGETNTLDNKEFLVKNPKHKIKANMPYALRFYLRYDPANPAPQLIAFRLNAKTLCPEGAATEAPPSVDMEYTSNTLAALAGAIQPTPPTTFERPSLPPNQANQKIDCGTVVRSPSRGKRQSGYFSDHDHRHHHHHHWVDNRSSPSGVTDGGSAPSEVVPTPLITFGQTANEGEFPWHVALYQERGPDLQYTCGGSLVSNNFVLTVAHCVTVPKSETVLDVEVLLVYLGKYYLKKWSNPGIQSSQVDSLFPHAEFNGKTLANDIALIKLKRPVVYTDYVRPVCLWEGDSSLTPILDRTGTVAGWGLDENSKLSEKLTQAKMPVVSKETCIYSYPAFFSTFTTRKTYCAGFRNGTSACTGDSGGGMIFTKPTSTRDNPIWQLRGLVSLSVARHFKCDATHYVVFTDVAKYLEWINAMMKN